MLKKTISLSILAIALLFPAIVKADEINVRAGDVIIYTNDDGVKINTRGNQIRLNDDNYNYNKSSRVYRQNSRLKRYNYWSKNRSSQKLTCRINGKTVRQESWQINNGDRSYNTIRTYQNCK